MLCEYEEIILKISFTPQLIYCVLISQTKVCITQGWSKYKISLINVFVTLSKTEILIFSLFVLLTFHV